MKPLFFPLALTVLFFACFFPLQAQEVPAPDPRLKAILDEISALQSAATTETETRKKKYLEDLAALEKKIQATGNLDKVLLVSNERKAWEAGKPTPTMDPKDESIVLDLRKLRYYFDQDVAAIAAAAKQNSKKARVTIEQEFVALERELTTEGKIPQALEARKLREQFVAGTLAALPEKEIKSDIPEMPAADGKPGATPVSFPLSDPDEYPPLPMEKGRLVLIQYPESSEEFDKQMIDEIERDGYDDLVILAEVMSSTEVAAIRANANPVCWKKGGDSIKPRNVSAAKIWSSLGAGLIWVDAEGNVAATGGDADYRKSLEELGKVRYFSPTHNLALAIDDLGNRHVTGPAQKHENATRLMQYKDSVVSVVFGGLNYVMFLQTDGSVIELLTGKEPNTLSPPQTCHNLLDYGVARVSDGSVVCFNFRKEIGTRISESGMRAVKMRSHTGRFQVAQLENGAWLILKRAGWQRMEQFEKALSGALDVYPTGAGIVAILPAGSVPRSGLWDLNELIEARK